VNGEERQFFVPVHKTLLEVLGEDLERTDPKHGCEFDECGTWTVLMDGELVTSVRVPPPAPGQRECYLRFNPGSVDDFPTVGVAARAVLDESGAISDLAVALGGVAPVPILIREAPTDAAEAAERACDPVDDRRGSAAYKRAMARVWTRRALAQLLG